MDQVELLGRVRELRSQGRSPKEIARTLGVSPSVVAPMVRTVAAEQHATAGEPEVAGCWVNVGWSNGLTFEGARGWNDEAPQEDGAAGLVSVLVARRHGWDKVSVCGYLADVYCLGIKNTIGPDVMDEVGLRRFRDFFFGEYSGRQEASIELARHLVLGSVDYARRLGFEPHEDFASTSGHLGEWEEEAAITFGKNGKPFYVSGPNDDHRKVVRTLERTVGPQPAFEYVVNVFG